MKTVFLDRDGVINLNPPNKGYVCNWTEFTFIQNALNAVACLFRSGFNIYIVTNQAGIGRGIITEKQLTQIHVNMIYEIESNGGFIQQVYYCPHHPDDNCDCRKPKPGMLHKAAKDHKIDLSKSFLIGDSLTDIEAAMTAGVIPILVLTGHGRDSYRFYTEHAFSPNLHNPAKIFTNLYSASRWLTNV